MTRREKLDLMRDILDHLGEAFDEWTQADGRTEHYLAGLIQRDLAEFGRLCESLRTQRMALPEPARSPLGV